MLVVVAHVHDSPSVGGYVRFHLGLRHTGLYGWAAPTSSPTRADLSADSFDQSNATIAGTVGWEPLLTDLGIDKPSEFVRRGSVFVVRFCIPRKYLW